MSVNKDKKELENYLYKSTQDKLIDAIAAHEILYRTHYEEDEETGEGVLVNSVQILAEIQVLGQVRNLVTPPTDSFKKSLLVFKMMVDDMHRYNKVLKSPILIHNDKKKEKKATKETLKLKLDEALKVEAYEEAAKIQKKLDKLKK